MNESESESGSQSQSGTESSPEGNGAFIIYTPMSFGEESSSHSESSHLQQEQHHQRVDASNESASHHQDDDDDDDDDDDRLQRDDENESDSDSNTDTDNENDDDINVDASTETADFSSPIEQHSYLPGTQHPLYPAQFLRNAINRTSIHSSTEPTATPTHLNGNPDSSSNSSSSPTIVQPKTIEIPILQMDVVLFPNTTLPLRITNRSFCEYLRREIDHARASNCDLQVRIGVVTRLRERRRIAFQRRRRQNMRQARVRAGAGEDAEVEERERNGMRTSSGRMGRWNMSLIRRNFAARSGGSDDGEEGEDTTSSMNTTTSDNSERQDDRLNPEEESINYGRTAPLDRLKDRIGTFATVTSVSMDDASLHENQHAPQIIVTALTTGCFQVLSPANGAPSMDDFEWRMYHVREMNDVGILMPSTMRRPRPSKETSKTEICLLQRKMKLIDDMSRITPIPSLALRLIWPAKLVRDIVDELKSNDAYKGICKSLPIAKDQYEGSFSFWLSSNLPLSHTEKLDLLETYSEVERLRLLLYMIQKRAAFIRCKQCHSNIAKIGSVFSLHASAGTSGAYVNEYGVVHHTTTIKHALETAVVCHGAAETRDSWFPGYSWTIAYCSTCYNHLGWKFLAVKSGLETDQFWGLSGSQIV